VANLVRLRYLLDTNILSALIRQPQGAAAATLARRGYGTVCTSIVVAAELRFGARTLGSRALTRKADDLLASVPVLGFDAGADHTYAEIGHQPRPLRAIRLPGMARLPNAGARPWPTGRRPSHTHTFHPTTAR
jgi:predicted nucleic acid-binding protein